MSKIIPVVLIVSLLANLALFLKALDYRRKMVMAWAQTHHWVESYQNAPRSTIEAAESSLVLLGASITANWEASYFAPGRRVINVGIDGQYSGQLLLRFKHDVLDRKPEGVLIKLCEMNFSHNVPEKVSMDNLIMMAMLAQVHNVRPYLATTIPVSRRISAGTQSPEIINQRVKTFNEGVRAFAQQHSFPLVDLAAAMSDEDGYLYDRLAVDGVHPSHEGYQVMTRVLEKALEK